MENRRHDDEVVERIRELEQKVDVLIAYMERSLGAWMFIKIMGACAVGFTVLYQFVEHVFKK